MGRVGSPEHPGLASGLPKPGGEISRSRNGGKAASQPPPSVESYGRTRTHFVVFPGTHAMEARRAFGFSMGSGSPFNGPDRAVVATLQSLVLLLLNFEAQALSLFLPLLFLPKRKLFPSSSSYSSILLLTSPPLSPTLISPPHLSSSISHRNDRKPKQNVSRGSVARVKRATLQPASR